MWGARDGPSTFMVSTVKIQEAGPPGMSLALLNAVLFILIFPKKIRSVIDKFHRKTWFTIR